MHLVNNNTIEDQITEVNRELNTFQSQQSQLIELKPNSNMMKRNGSQKQIDVNQAVKRPLVNDAKPIKTVNKEPKIKIVIHYNKTEVRFKSRERDHNKLKPNLSQEEYQRMLAKTNSLEREIIKLKHDLVASDARAKQIELQCEQKISESATELRKALERLVESGETVTRLKEQINSMTEVQTKIQTDARIAEKDLRDANVNLTLEINQLKQKIGELTQQLNLQPKPSIDEKPADLLSQMIQIGQVQKLPIMPKLLSGIARLEHRAGMSVREYLGFGMS